MIEPAEAAKVVEDCIHEVAHTKEEYDAEKSLFGQFGIIADFVVWTFTREIRENTEAGVRAFNHTLSAKELTDVTSETIAGEVEDIIMDKVEIGPGNASKALLLTLVGSYKNSQTTKFRNGGVL